MTLFSLEEFRRLRDTHAIEHYQARLSELKAELQTARAQCPYAPPVWMARLKNHRDAIRLAWRTGDPAQAHRLSERLFEEVKPYAAAMRIKSEIERIEALLLDVLEKEVL